MNHFILHNNAGLSVAVPNRSSRGLVQNKCVRYGGTSRCIRIPAVSTIFMLLFYSTFKIYFLNYLHDEKKEVMITEM